MKNRSKTVNLWSLVLVMFAASCAFAEPHTNSSRTTNAEPRLEKKVKYATAQASVQDIAQSLAQQVGLQYDWQRSHNQTDPECRQWVRNVAIEGKTCREALEQVLSPVGLRYQVENGTLVLYRDKSKSAGSNPLEKKVKYSAQKASVQDVVQALAQQVGLKYDFQTSLNQTRPLCQRWVNNVAIENKTCREALEEVLKPVGLRYEIENGVLVLNRGS